MKERTNKFELLIIIGLLIFTGLFLFTHSYWNIVAILILVLCHIKNEINKRGKEDEREDNIKEI